MHRESPILNHIIVNYNTSLISHPNLRIAAIEKNEAEDNQGMERVS